LSLRLVGSIEPSNQELPRVYLALGTLRDAEKLVRGQKVAGIYGDLFGKVDEERQQVIVRKVEMTGAMRQDLQLLGVVYLGNLSAWSPIRTELALCFSLQQGIKSLGASPAPPYFGWYGSEMETPVKLPGYFVYEETSKLKPQHPRDEEVDDIPEKRAVRIEVPPSRTVVQQPATTRVLETAPPQVRATSSRRSPIRIDPVRKPGQNGAGRNGAGRGEPVHLKWFLADQAQRQHLASDKPLESGYLQRQHQGRLELELPEGIAYELASKRDLFGLISLDRISNQKDKISLLIIEYFGYRRDISKEMDFQDKIKSLLLGTLPDPLWGLLYLRHDCYRIYYNKDRKKRKIKEDKRQEVDNVRKNISNMAENKFSVPEFQSFSTVRPFQRFWVVVTDTGCAVYDSFQRKYSFVYSWDPKRSYRREDDSLVLVYQGKKREE
jgi:hypothetical protein